MSNSTWLLFLAGAVICSIIFMASLSEFSWIQVPTTPERDGGLEMETDNDVLVLAVSSAR